MPTTFANTIDGNEILAKRSQCDYAGNDIQTTYAAKSELPSANQLVPTSTSADANKVLTVNSQGNAEWTTAAQGGVTDVEVDGTSVVSGGVASITMPTVDQTYNAASTNAQSGVAVASAISTKQDTVSDLATIRSGAALGATAVQPGDLATVATTGAYSDLTGTPTIPPALSAGNGIDITNNVVSADLDGTSLTNGANGLSVTLPVPDTTGASQGDVLSVGQNGIEWATPSSGGGNVFMATSTTTFPELWQAFYEDGKIVYCTSGSASSLSTPYFLQKLKANDSGHTTGTATFVQFNRYSTGRIEVFHSKVTFSSNRPTLGTVTFTRQIIVPDNPESHVGEFLTAQSSGSVTFASVNQVPASTSADADKVLTVDAQGTPAWATPAAGGVTDVEVDGVSVVRGDVASITMPTVDQTYDASSTNAQSGTAVAEAIATKEDAFDVGTGLEMDTSGATPTLQVDIVAGPGIAIDNPDGNTLRVSQAYPTDETVLWNNNRVWCGSDSVPGTKSGTLSETVSNFERIRVYFARNNDTNLLSGNTSEFDTGEITTKGGIFISTIFINAASGALFSAHTFLALSGLTFTETMGSQWKQSDNNLDTRKVYLHPYKIVGIHRIASN